MSAPAPAVSERAARGLLESRFGLSGELTPLVSERDQNFSLTTVDGRRFVLKIANPGEAPEVLVFQARALVHVAEQAPQMPVPHVVRTADGESLVRIDTSGASCLARVVTWVPGVPVAGVPWTPTLRRNLATTLARLGLALRGFFHPAARHPLLWDVQQASAVAVLVDRVSDPARRTLAQANFERHARRTMPILAGLRAQVIHNDCNPDNLLADEVDTQVVSGIIDFGDMVHTPLINDLAVAIAYQIVGATDPVAAASELVSAYHDVRPLESDELAVLFDLVILRLTMSVCICAWRAEQHPDNVAYILGNHEAYWRTLEYLAELDVRQTSAAFRAACEPGGGTRFGFPGVTDEKALRRRRDALLGPSLRLSYSDPLYLVRGEGVRLFDASGRAYLDAYNNVACVGHAHPAVVAAIATQARRLNTNTRYLHDNIVDYAERLSALLPDSLSVCFFVCTGSEANDLAWQIARSVSGGDGAIVTAFAYHGNTTAVADLSPEEAPPGRQADWVVTVPAPDRYRGSHARDMRFEDAGDAYAAHLDTAIAALASRGRRPAAFFVDTIYTSDGIHIAPPGYLAGAWSRVRAAGGLCIADEVQAGFGRTGDHFWGFAQQGVVPDIVTLGKPMGNGHPLAAVVTTPDIAAAFAKERYYFNTFGGNPVSCAAGLAVLDVLESEHLMQNAREVGQYLGQRLDELASRHELIGDVRGAGLFHGVEIVADRTSHKPAEAAAKAIVDGMRRAGVLIGRTGVHANVLKIRPPLIFSRGNTDELVAVLDAELEDVLRIVR